MATLGERLTRWRVGSSSSAMHVGPPALDREPHVGFRSATTVNSSQMSVAKLKPAIGYITEMLLSPGRGTRGLRRHRRVVDASRTRATAGETLDGSPACGVRPRSSAVGLGTRGRTASPRARLQGRRDPPAVDLNAPSLPFPRLPQLRRSRPFFERLSRLDDTFAHLLVPVRANVRAVACADGGSFLGASSTYRPGGYRMLGSGRLAPTRRKRRSE
jgi:hypothetical protein